MTDRLKSRSRKPSLKALEEYARLLDLDVRHLVEALGELDADSRDHDLRDANLNARSGRVTPAFFATPYRLMKSQRRTRHRLGGSILGTSPVCTSCGTSLVLFANLDATDRRLQSNYPFKRLPLYYCCSCPASVYYRANKDGKVTVFPSKRPLGEETPLRRPRNGVPKGFLDLHEVNSEAENAIQKLHQLGSLDSLTLAERKSIASLLGRRVRGSWDTEFSQIGGDPRSYQGGEEGVPRLCPNTSCPFRRRTRLECKYRPLAVLDLWSDKFWGIKPLDAAQIVLSICPGCFSIAATYTCT